MLENTYSDPLLLAQQNNCFIIDWLTFVCFGDSVDYVKWLLGLDSPDIPWETQEKFRNGYPIQSYWNGITISYGADDERFYKDPTKARDNMGICVNLSGTGCRAFETYGHGNWLRLFGYIFRDTAYIASEQYKFYDYHITRVDLAYDDHSGILDIYRLESDTRDRNYVARAKYSEIVWSDNQEDDIQGITVQIGSNSSEVKIRIYDKAAERKFKDRHWIRCEIQLRKDRAMAACKQLLELQNIGRIAAGILRNYLTFREPSSDSNKSRWPIADYWDKLLLDMEQIKLWLAPGEPYNFAKTEYYLVRQYGPAIVTLAELTKYKPDYLIAKCRQCFPVKDLPPKYKKYLVPFDKE